MLNTMLRGQRRRVIGATVAGLAIAALSACDSDSATEQLIESASDGAVDVDDGNINIETEDGSANIDLEDGDFSATDENGETVTGNVDVDGDGSDFNVETEDGEFEVSSDGGIPDEWPEDVPQPEGIENSTSTVTSDSESLAIFVVGSAGPDFVTEYGTALEAAGFEETSSFESPGTITNSYEMGTVTVAVSVIGEGDDAQASVTLVDEAGG